MGTKYNDQEEKNFDDHNQSHDQKPNPDIKFKTIGIKDEAQNVIGGTSGNSPTNEQASASQNNQWQQNHNSGSVPNPGQERSDQYENNSRPSHEFSASEDDELQSEMHGDYRKNEFIEENNLERTDQDYRDGDNQFGENQDDGDELRNGK